MGSNISKTVTCEALPDPTIVPPPPGNAAAAAAGQGGYGMMMGQPPPNEPYGSPKYKCNPGSYEELHKKCREIFPMPFEGAKFVVSRGLSQALQLSHSWSLSAITPSGYRFSGTYIGSRMIAPNDPALLLMAELDPSGNLNAQGIYHYTEGLKLKYALQIADNKFASTQISSDVRGKDWTATATFANLNLFKNTGIGVFQYLQSVTRRISLGAEFMYQQAPTIPGGVGAAVLSVGGRYTGDESVWSGYAGTATFGMCYYRRLTDFAHIGLEVDNNYAQGATNVAFGCQYDHQRANFIFKAMLDNNWTVTAVIEKRLFPMPGQLSICGALNHLTNQFRLGCGFSVGV